MPAALLDLLPAQDAGPGVRLKDGAAQECAHPIGVWKMDPD